MSTTTELVEQLSKEFGQLKKMPLEDAVKLDRMIDQAPVEALIMIVKADIRFCASVARKRLHLVHGWTWEEIDALPP